MADRGWLRFHILFIDNNPAAFQIGIQHQRTYYPEHRGFDSDWKNLCIGTTLFMKVFEELCVDPEVDLIDFNPGDADYKLLFADDQQCPEATVYLFAPRPYTILLNMLSSSTRALTTSFEFTLRKIGFEHQIKYALRTLLGVK